jgi:hypothetical protein
MKTIVHHVEVKIQNNLVASHFRPVFKICPIQLQNVHDMSVSLTLVCQPNFFSQLFKFYMTHHFEILTQ